MKLHKFLGKKMPKNLLTFFYNKQIEVRSVTTRRLAKQKVKERERENSYLPV
jgi:hypothetical protein